MNGTELRKKSIRVFTILLMMLAATLCAWSEANADTAIPVSAKINSSSGVNVRKSASTTSTIVAYSNDNAKITINYELFLTSNSTKAKKVWYNVKAGGKTGFVRKDLVDTLKYTAVTGKTTDALNYRVGAGAGMEKVGTLKKGAKVSVVAIAYAKDTSDKWYKIKKGTKYYYVSAYWVELTTTGESEKKDDTKVEEPVSTEEASFVTNNVSTPQKIAVGCKFSIIGTIECNLPMTSVKVGVINTSNKWVTYKTTYLGEKTFDIATVDASIKFGKLAVGSYQYRVQAKVNGSWHVVVSKSFSVAKVKWPTHLGDVAVNLAWPLGTDSALYLYSTGSPTPEYQAALDSSYPTHSTLTQNGKGASCDVFIGTVCRYSGYDSEMPSGLSSQQKYLASSEKWQEVDYTYDESQLKHGDICTYTNNNNNKHICMYVVIDGKGYIAEASYTQKKYGFISTDVNKVLKSSRAPNIKVYRAAS